MAQLEILTAEEFKRLDSLARQAARRAARQTPLVQFILRTFVQRSGPIPVDDIMAALPGTPAGALVALDDDDVIRVRDGRIDIAYPLSAAPTPFVVRLPGGRERYACCATDALGIAPMIGEPIDIRTACHHCGTPLRFPATPEGVGPEADGAMVWMGRRGDTGGKACDAL